MMSNDPRKQLQTLDAATAADDRRPEAMPAEAAELRATWLALGELLESMQPPHPAVLERVTAAAAPRLRRRRVSRRIAAAGALAAGVLLAVLLADRWRSRPASPDDGAGPAAVASSAAPADVAASPAGAAAGAARLPVDAAGPSVAWDDAVEENLSQIEQGLIALRSGSLTPWSELAGVQGTVERIEAEVQGGSL